ncbi:MAG: hypothetical protein LBC67_06175 [Spirochaetales bacterium]|jgi:hypothetical protein|nr:hypothetical protein [Spirochaetales bacterium]
MESPEKIIFTALFAFLFFGCKSPPLVIIQDPLVIEEIAPLPRTVIVKPQTEYEPVYTVLRIVEVSEVNGIQKFFLVRMGPDKTNLVSGGGGEIGDDAEFKRIIGTYKIIEVYGDFFRCEVERLDYKIGSAAHIRIKTGERIKQ